MTFSLTETFSAPTAAQTNCEASHMQNWQDHDLLTALKTLNAKKPNSDEVARALVDITLQWHDLGTNAYRLANLLTTTLNIFGRDETFRITGRLSLMLPLEAPLYSTIQSWCRTVANSDQQTQSLYIQ